MLKNTYKFIVNRELYRKPFNRVIFIFIIGLLLFSSCNRDYALDEDSKIEQTESLNELSIFEFNDSKLMRFRDLSSFIKYDSLYKSMEKKEYLRLMNSMNIGTPYSDLMEVIEIESELMEQEENGIISESECENMLLKMEDKYHDLVIFDARGVELRLESPFNFVMNRKNLFAIHNNLYFLMENKLYFTDIQNASNIMNIESAVNIKSLESGGHINIDKNNVFYSIVYSSNISSESRRFDEWTEYDFDWWKTNHRIKTKWHAGWHTWETIIGGRFHWVSSTTNYAYVRAQSRKCGWCIWRSVKRELSISIESQGNLSFFNPCGTDVLDTHVGMRRTCLWESWLEIRPTATNFRTGDIVFGQPGGTHFCPSFEGEIFWEDVGFIGEVEVIGRKMQNCRTIEAEVNFITRRD